MTVLLNLVFSFKWLQIFIVLFDYLVFLKNTYVTSLQIMCVKSGVSNQCSKENGNTGPYKIV